MAELNQGLFFLTTPQPRGPAGRAGAAGGAWPATASRRRTWWRACSSTWQRRRARCRCSSSRPLSSGSSGIRCASCSPSRATPAWAASPERWPVTPTVCWTRCLLRGRRWPGPCCYAWSRRSAPAPSSPWRSWASCRQDTRELRRVTDQLVQARLLVVQTGGEASGATVELVHESLIHGWPTLKRWLDESQEDSGFLEQLRNAARQWQAKRRDSGLLWGGEMVEEAQPVPAPLPGRAAAGAGGLPGGGLRPGGPLGAAQADAADGLDSSS